MNGSLTNSDHAKPKSHSSYAYKILRSLVVAQIANPIDSIETSIMMNSNDKIGNYKHETEMWPVEISQTLKNRSY